MLPDDVTSRLALAKVQPNLPDKPCQLEENLVAITCVAMQKPSTYCIRSALADCMHDGEDD